MKYTKTVHIVSLLVCLVLLIITILPLGLMLVNSFKSNVAIANNPLSLPKTIHVTNFVRAWKFGHLGTALVNSVLITILTVVVTILVSCMAAYVLSTKRMKHWKAMSIYFLACNTIPKQLFIIPLFFILQRMGLINNRVALAVIYSAIFTPFAIFLLRTYFLQIDKDIENSARVDGAGSLRIFFSILLPLIQPGILTAALIVGLWCWNEFLFAVTFLQNDLFYTVAVRFYSFTSRYVTEWGTLMAYAVMITIPILLFFIILQKRFISGMTAGGVKG
ncbi:carbohydrate ABC transporter permease [Sediminispirochaeta bajacaliforniensis]|uniref:carbohydrate ABC transporter permease n=1 Tax=Sediminispirochaeta bajacaliforniensis TaxID=148 RepID=UPI00037652F6|nr:carbohydrate ABC transporter permease [Sediminispirochaeta bajacaliforniensis]